MRYEQAIKLKASLMHQDLPQAVKSATRQLGRNSALQAIRQRDRDRSAVPRYRITALSVCVGNQWPAAGLSSLRADSTGLSRNRSGPRSCQASMRRRP